MSSGKSELDSTKKKKKEKSQQQAPAVDVIDESHKEYYLVQIKDLEDRIIKHQKASDESEIINSKLEEKFLKSAEDQKDIAAYVQKKLAEKEMEVSEIQRQITSVEHLIVEETNQFEKQHELILTEFQSTKEQLLQENSALSVRLASLDDLRVQRLEVLQKINDLEKALTKQADDRRESIYTLEKTHIMNKDRLKKEMQDQIEAMGKSFGDQSKKQLIETTHKAIETNVTESRRLDQLAAVSVRLVGENNVACRRLQEDSIRREILEENERQLTRKYNACLRKLNIYKEKYREMIETEMLNEYDDSSVSQSTTDDPIAPSPASNRRSVLSTAN